MTIVFWIIGGIIFLLGSVLAILYFTGPKKVSTSTPTHAAPAAHPTPAPAHAAPVAPAPPAPAHGHGGHGHATTPSKPSGPWYKSWPFIMAVILAVIIAIGSTYITPTGNEGLLTLIVAGFVIFLVVFLGLWLLFWLISLIFRIISFMFLLILLVLLGLGWYGFDYYSRTKVEITVQVYYHGSKTKTYPVTQMIRLGNETVRHQFPPWFLPGPDGYTVRVLTVGRKVKIYHPSWKKAVILTGGELGPKVRWPDLPGSASLQLADITPVK